MDRFVEIRFQGKTDQFFIVSYQILDSSSKVMERGEASLPSCPELVANIKDWRAAYQADIRHTRLEVVGSSITNSSEIDHYKLANNLKKSLNNWLNSPEFLSVKDELIAKLSPDQVILVGIDVPDPILKYTPWHLWSFFKHFPKADFALLRPSFSRVNPRKNNHKSGLNILAIIGDSWSINTGEDETIIKSLPHIHDLKILSEPSKQKVKETLWGESSTDILFFAGHGKRERKQEKKQGKICINKSEGLSIEEIKSALRKRIQQGLQLAIFNSCDGLELGEEIADLHIPQTIVMKEAVPDDIAQRFLKDFLLEFSGGVPLVQALRQTRDRLADCDKDYPYASWLPVLYCNPTEPLMQWHQPNLAQRYPWQTRLVISCLVGLISVAGMGFLPQVRELKNNVLGFDSTSLNKTYQDPEFQLHYPQTWQAQEELDGVSGDIAKILLLDNREVQLTINIRDLTSTRPPLEDWRKQLLEYLEKHGENFSMIKQKSVTLALRPGYEIIFTTTENGKTYKKVVITALKNNKAYSAIYSAPEDLFTEYELVAREMISSLNLAH